VRNNEEVNRPSGQTTLLISSVFLGFSCSKMMSASLRHRPSLMSHEYPSGLFFFNFDKIN